MSETACEEFYRRSDEVTQMITNNIQGAAGYAAPIRIEFGAPLVMDGETARHWLSANYSLAADFFKGRPPAMGEVSVFLSDSKRKGENGIIIPKECLDCARQTFSSLRKVEGRFNGNNGSSLYQHMSERNNGFKVPEAHGNPLEECQHDPDLVPRSGIWEIRTPSSEYFDERKTKKGGIYRMGGHTHVGNKHWMDSVLSRDDFEVILYQWENDAEKPTHREDVMNIPISVLLKLQENLENGGSGNGNGEIAEMIEKGSYLEKTLATDMLGLRFVWNLPRRKLGVRPIVSKPHYIRARGNVLCGESMNIKGCYIDVNTDYPDFSDHTPVLADARSYVAQYAKMKRF